jgi:hypothetical protein
VLGLALPMKTKSEHVPKRVSRRDSRCEGVVVSVVEGAAVLRLEAMRLVEAGAFGRSTSYRRLLEYLVDCAEQGRAPKELEIAIEVFGKSANFDTTTDSMVRVYAHNLRQKLDVHYAKDASAGVARLVLPRGEYRVQLAPAPRGAEPAAAVPAAALPVAPRARSVPPFAATATATALAAALLALGVLVGWVFGSLRGAPLESSVAASHAWAPLLDDDLPILLVVGDYYIFGERDARGEVERLVRYFDVNSSKELDDLMLYDANVRGRYLDLDLTYLPTGTAFAMREVLEVLHDVGKPLRVVSMSELSAADLKTGHVVYLGYISALGMLEEFVFSSSGLAVGMSYDELRNLTTGEIYASGAAMAATHRNYRDYAFVSAFPGPSGNHFLVVTGTRDAGLMQAAHVLTDPLFVAEVENRRPWAEAGRAAPAFELLYEVSGYGRTSLDAMLVHSGALSYRRIWGGNPLYFSE